MNFITAPIHYSCRQRCVSIVSWSQLKQVIVTPVTNSCVSPAYNVEETTAAKAATPLSKRFHRSIRSSKRCSSAPLLPAFIETAHSGRSPTVTINNMYFKIVLIACLNAQTNVVANRLAFWKSRVTEWFAQMKWCLA